MLSIRSHLVAAVGAVAMLAAPLAILPMADMPDGYAAFAGNGKGGGKGNGGGNGNGGGSEKSQGKSESSSKSVPPGQAKKSEQVATLGAGKSAKTKNLNAQLAGLNSLKRNINGLMNSSDPRMAAIRTYVVNGAELELAQQQLLAAQEALVGAEGAFASLASDAGLTSYDGLYAYDDLTLGALSARYAELQAVVLDPADPNYELLQTELTTLQLLVESPEALTLVTAQGDVSTAEGVVATETAGTTDADLTEALRLAANKNRLAAAGDAYVTPEILEWAKQQLGTGEYTGAIDAYLAKL